MYLNFPSTGIFCSLMSFWLSELPVSFDNKHSQLLKKGLEFYKLNLVKGFINTNHSP